MKRSLFGLNFRKLKRLQKERNAFYLLQRIGIRTQVTERLPSVIDRYTIRQPFNFKAICPLQKNRNHRNVTALRWIF